MGIKRKWLYVAIVLTVAIGGTLVDYNRKKEAELTKIRQEQELLKAEQQQLLETKQLLEKQKVELEQSNEQLKKQIEAKAQVRVASVKSIKPGAEQWRPLCEKYFAGQVQNCLTMISRESGGNPRAVSKTDDHGLAQIHCDLWCNFFKVSREDLKEPELNIRLARVIYDRAGSWRPWTSMR